MTIISPSQARQTAPHAYGMFLILCATVLFSLMSLCVRLASGSFRSDSFVFFRSFIQALCLLPWISHFWPERGNIYATARVHFVRGIAGVISMWCLYLALHFLPLGLTSILTMSSVLWAAILGRIFLGEHQGTRRLLYGGVVCLGLLIVLWPGSGSRWEMPWPGVLGALLCGVSMGFAQTLVRQMRRTRGVAEIVFWFGVVGTVFMLPFFIRDPQWPRSFREWSLILAMGITAAGGQLFLTAGFRYTPTFLGSLAVFCGTVWNIGLGFFVLSEVPPIQFWWGVAVVMGGLFLLMRTPPEPHDRLREGAKPKPSRC